MIRIKCPKCATSLSLPDSDAGGVGECTECGSKFRVPAAKAVVPVRADRDEDDDEDDDDDEEEEEERASGRRRHPRRRQEEDEEDEKALDEEDEDRRRRLAAQRSAAIAMNIRMAIGLFVATVIAFIGGMFINRVGLYAAIFGFAIQVLCMIMISALAKQESTMWFMLVRFVPGMLIVYIVLYWDQVKRFVITYVAGVLIFGVGLGSMFIYEVKKTARRELIERRVNADQGKQSWHWQRAAEVREAIV
jgi:cation transport ATPase